MGNCGSDQRAIQGRLISVGEASKILAVSGETIRNWCDAGELEFVRTFGGHRRVGLRSIKLWLGEEQARLEEEEKRIEDERNYERTRLWRLRQRHPHEDINKLLTIYSI